VLIQVTDPWLLSAAVASVLKDARPCLRSPHHECDGRAARFALVWLPEVRVAVAWNIDQLKGALRESEEQRRLALEAAALGTWDWDVAADSAAVDARGRELFGFPQERPISYATALAAIHPDDRALVEERVRAVLEPSSDGSYEVEHRVVWPDGSVHWLLAKGRARFAGEGADRRAVRFVGTVMDITARKRTDAALRESEEHLRLALDAGRMGTWDWNVHTGGLAWDSRQCELFGVEPARGPHLSAQDFLQRVHPDDLARVERAMDAALAAQRKYEVEFRVIGDDGRERWLAGKGDAVRGADGQPVRMIGVNYDITERRQAEAESADNAARLRLIADAVPALISYVDAGQRYRFVNSGYEHWFGQYRGDIEGRTLREFLGDEAYEAIREQVAAALAGNSVIFESMVPYRSGGTRYVEARYRPHRSPTGEVLGFYALIIDISDRRRADQAVARAAAMRRAILDAVPAHIAVIDGTGNIVATNAAWDRFALENGYRGPRPWTGVNYLVVCDAARGERAEGAAAVARGIRAVLAGRLKRFTPEAEYACHGPKHMRWFELIAVPLSDQPSEGAVIMHVDMTERRQAEHALREREDQLRQAQKMEALGQLTGGIAHDFNNLLALVMMDLEMMAELAGRKGKLRALAEEARAVAQGGAELTQRMLAFARLQRLEPRPVQLNDLIAGLVDLLRRSLGELVEIRTELQEGLWPAQADPGQLENAILNLAINARDAMPRGGVITIRTASEGPSETESPEGFVRVTVADTGQGMTPEVLERAFEPFFTTKEAGRGTGLGLSMVYGFVTQSGGEVRIRSRLGRGTEVTLRLPRAQSDVVPAERVAAAKPHGGSGETILVVEDQGALRRRIAAALSDLHYRAIEAGDAAEALERLEAGAPVDLLFTDIVMPGGLDGRQLAQQVRERWPEVRVLFTSGFPDHLRRVAGAEGLDFPLLAKPYSIDELTRAVRRALDGSTVPSTGAVKT
jgi:PAS domain S-box-containing protein